MAASSPRRRPLGPGPAGPSRSPSPMTCPLTNKSTPCESVTGARSRRRYLGENHHVHDVMRVRAGHLGGEGLDAVPQAAATNPTVLRAHNMQTQGRPTHKFAVTGTQLHFRIDAAATVSRSHSCSRHTRAPCSRALYLPPTASTPATRSKSLFRSPVLRGSREGSWREACVASRRAVMCRAHARNSTPPLGAALVGGQELR